ncbi:MAG: hypothetical protein RLZZ272_478 [Actinomycetota bacterium]
MRDGDPDHPVPRSSRALLLDGAFGPFFAGKVLATIGIWIHNVAAAILVHRLTGSALLVGAVSVGQFVPQLLLAPWSGARADRRDRRRQVILGVGVTTAGAAGLTVWSAVSGLDGRRGAAAIIAAATVVGIGFALSGPAMQAMIPQLVRPTELTTAIAMTSIPMMVARTTGPALGALLITAGGPVATFGTTVGLNVLYLGALARTRPRPDEQRHDRPRDLLAGWRFARSDPRVARALVAIAIIGVGVDPVITLTPSLVAELREPAALVGVMASAFGGGAATAFLLLGAVRRRLGLPATGTLGLGVLAASLLVASLAPSGPVAIAAFAVGGIGMTLALPSFTAVIQRTVPDAVRGRVMALWSVAFLGSRPLTASATGALTDATSVRVALLVSVVTIVIGAWMTRQPYLPDGPLAPSAEITSASVV